MAHFYQPGLLILVVLMVTSECRGTEIVSATQEEDVALPCFNTNVTDLKSCYRVKWIKHATDPSLIKVILARPKMRKIQDAERVKWEADGKGQMSLFLTKVQKSDEGLYSCQIYQGWDCTFVKNISLKVKECKGQAVKATLNTPATMKCPVDMTAEQQGPQNVSWVVLKGGNPVPFNPKRAEINGTSLVIQTVNSGDSGWYRCMYMLGQTQRCFDINLQLKEVENVVVATTVQALTTTEIILKIRKEESTGAFIAVTASVIIAIVIVAALIGFFIYRRRNKRNAQQTQRHSAGTHIESDYGYEIVELTQSEDSSNQRLNSLYRQCQDEELCTFQY